MFSPSDQDGILDALGDKFLGAVVTSVDGARADLEDMRTWRPGWFPTMAARTLANIIHDRVWAHICLAIEDDPAVTAIDKEPRRELTVGSSFQFRIKRHTAADMISTYETPGAMQFWAQEAEAALPGMELITLGAGYRWIAETRQIGAAVISCRAGKDHPIWSVELMPGSGGATGITWSPVEGPDLPVIDVHGVVAEQEDGGAES